MLIQSKKMEDFAHNLAVQEEIKGRSLFADALRRFLYNKAAMVSVFSLTCVVLFAAFGNLASSWTHAEIDWDIAGQIREAGGPSIANGHYFGVDSLGRDLYKRVIQGSQISLMIGIIGASIAVLIGTLYGAISGFSGGKTDNIMMRIVDILQSIPGMFVLILLLVIFGRSIFMLFVGIGLLSWVDMSRIVRGQTLSLKKKEFVEAAIATGVHPFVIICRHIIPNLLGIVTVYATLLVPGMIMAESFISFLGLGIQEPLTSWGALINEGAATMQHKTLWQLIVPMFFFTVTLFSFYFIGDGLRDALDPKEDRK